MSHYDSDGSDSSSGSSSGSSSESSSYTRKSSSSGRSTKTRSSKTSHATIKDGSKAIRVMQYMTGAHPGRALALRKTKVRETEQYVDYNDETVYFDHEYITYAWVVPKFDDSASQFGSTSGRSSRSSRSKKSQPRFVPPQRPPPHFQHPRHPPNRFPPPPHGPVGGDAGFIDLNQGPPPPHGPNPAFFDLNAQGGPPAGDPWRQDSPPMMGGNFRPVDDFEEWDRQG